MLCDFACPAVNHRMYVLEGSTSDPWTSNYTMKAQLNTFDQFAIDGTYFQHQTGLYHVYSCWYSAYESWPSNLCITKMSNPWTVDSNVTERQILSVPNNPWERTPYGRMQNARLSSNEGPEQLTNPKTGQQFIIYSAARSDNRNYCLGQLELVGDDPMNNQDWRKNNENCVFYQNALVNAYSVGHASTWFEYAVSKGLTNVATQASQPVQMGPRIGSSTMAWKTLTPVGARGTLGRRSSPGMTMARQIFPGPDMGRMMYRQVRTLACLCSCKQR